MYGLAYYTRVFGRQYVIAKRTYFVMRYTIRFPVPTARLSSFFLPAFVVCIRPL